jgi:hypothetical protein
MIKLRCKVVKGKGKPFKRDAGNVDPRRRGLLIWHGTGWRFPPNTFKRQLVWKPKTRVGWRFRYYELRREG